MVSIEDILTRIDSVLKENRRVEWTYILLTIVLFLCGISCFTVALITGHLAWSTPSTVTTGLLYFPLQQIKDIRRKNIALATAPMLITQLPRNKPAEEVQKLLQTLYGDVR